LKGRHWEYRDARGKRITGAREIRRISALGIPPAWTDVWICPLENAHLQATGRDARRRKQYRYHADWRTVREESKYQRMIAFGHALPRIRKTVRRDLAARGLQRRKVLAAITRLLETTLIRVGNEEYARQNGSFGLSTLRDRHVSIERGVLHFQFKGKSGKRHEIDLHDARLAEIVRRAQDLPGQDLFQYEDEEGKPQKITSEDVNGYLREIAGEEFSAKDFRTWAGTVLAAEALRQFETFDSHTQAKKNILRAIESVAAKLGNTPAICRKSYVHPIVLESYLSGSTIEVLEEKVGRTLRNHLAALSPAESAVLAFLQQRLSAATDAADVGKQLKRSLRALGKKKPATARRFTKATSGKFRKRARGTRKSPAAA